jgi:hypothetical protein
MAFKWTEGYHRSGNILDADEFNTSFNAFKGEINGGLDRENLPNASISNDELASNAMVKYVVVPNIRAQDTSVLDLEWAVTTGGTLTQEYIAVPYDTYAGGWRTNSAYNIGVSSSELFQEGMLHLEFNCWYYMRNHFANGTNQIWCQFQILVDGTPVVTSDRQHQNVGQIHLVADVPISTGSHSVQIRWRITPWPGSAAMDDPVFYYDGGQLTAINRYR